MAAPLTLALGDGEESGRAVQTHPDTVWGRGGKVRRRGKRGGGGNKKQKQRLTSARWGFMLSLRRACWAMDTDPCYRGRREAGAVGDATGEAETSGHATLDKRSQSPTC